MTETTITTADTAMATAAHIPVTTPALTETAAADLITTMITTPPPPHAVVLTALHPPGAPVIDPHTAEDLMQTRPVPQQHEAGAGPAWTEGSRRPLMPRRLKLFE